MKYLTSKLISNKNVICTNDEQTYCFTLNKLVWRGNTEIRKHAKNISFKLSSSLEIKTIEILTIYYVVLYDNWDTFVKILSFVIDNDVTFVHHHHTLRQTHTINVYATLSVYITFMYISVYSHECLTYCLYFLVVCILSFK